MKLEQIGFYTLSDQRARSACASSPLQRCELILTGRCNFRCPYCRRVGGPDMDLVEAMDVVKRWADDGLFAVRFSGGEPTLWKHLPQLVAYARSLGIQRIAVSTNGSNRREVYDELIEAGMNDCSVSLDACCAEDGDKMAGGIKGAWDKVVENIRYLSSRIYTTVGVVLTPDNAASLNGIVKFADSLGVSDIRVIPAAQCDDRLRDLHIDEALLIKYPILAYRIKNVNDGKPVRGIAPTDPKRCGLVLDDMAVNQGKHFPCIIYMREGGSPIGDVGPQWRQEREQWSMSHDCHTDPICNKNCLDVCVEYNRKYKETNETRLP